MSALPIALPVASGNAVETARSAAAQAPAVAGTVGTARGATRLGARRLSRLQSSLSDRDRSLLLSVGELRLVTSRHLEVLHFHDAATPLTAARKARRSLQRLVELGLLQRLDRQIGGLHAGSAAFIYALTDRGQRVLELPGPRRRSSEPAWPFVAHTLAVADLVVSLQQAVRQQAGRQLLDLQTEPQAWRGWTNLGGGRETLKPDLYLAVAAGDNELRWFVEVDRGTEHRPALLRKCRAYQTYYEAGVEQTREGVFPAVVWLLPDADRARQLDDLVRSERSLTAALFTMTTPDQVLSLLLELEQVTHEGGEHA